jgi:ribosome biogenesis GTPase
MLTSSTHDLIELGWNAHFEALVQLNPIQPGFFIARVVSVERDLSRVQISLQQSYRAEISGQLRFRAENKTDYPAVGDWVVCTDVGAGGDRVMMTEILERKNAVTRRAAGETLEQQVIASNIDWMFIATSVDGDFSIRRIERYMTLAYDSGVTPVILLTKIDLLSQSELDATCAQIDEAFVGVPVLPICKSMPETYGRIRELLTGRKTGVIVGSSGVGKSTLTNRLIGEDRLDTGPVREDDSKGRHTTTRRELFLTPENGIIIDTPGMRELQLTGEDRGIETLFSDVEAIALQCHFSDCSHSTEPRCAIQAALASGALGKDRLASYKKLLAEIRYLERKGSAALKVQDKVKAKKVQREMRAKNKSN